MDEIDKAWLAGLFDGEGSINSYYFDKTEGDWIYKGFVISISISNNCKEIVEKFKKLVGVNLKITEIKQGRYNHINYRLKIAKGEDIVRILKEIKPYLIAKKQQANLMIELIELRKSNYKKSKVQLKKMIDISDDISFLNRYG